MIEIDGMRLRAYLEGSWRGYTDSPHVNEICEQIYAQILGWA